MIDEFTRECLAIRVARRLNSCHVIEAVGDCTIQHGVPQHVRSDYGAEMTARRVKQWLQTVGTEPLFIEPGSPWENGYCESFNGTVVLVHLPIAFPPVKELAGGDVEPPDEPPGAGRNPRSGPAYHAEPRLRSEFPSLFF